MGLGRAKSSWGRRTPITPRTSSTTTTTGRSYILVNYCTCTFIKGNALKRGDPAGVAWQGGRTWKPSTVKQMIGKTASTFHCDFKCFLITG